MNKFFSVSISTLRKLEVLQWRKFISFFHFVPLHLATFFVVFCDQLCNRCSLTDSAEI